MRVPVDKKQSPGVEPRAELANYSHGLRRRRLGLVMFVTLAGVSLILDLVSKSWAERALTRRGPLDSSITVVKDHLWFALAYNKGGAWGLGNNVSDVVRRPFFIVVSIAAIFFIVSLYRKLHDHQWALKWGLPLVLGGALGNLADRIVRTGVVDFIQYRAEWVGTMNSIIHSIFSTWLVVEYWPTFNVADISICIGVGLMAIDMFTSKKHQQSQTEPPTAPDVPNERPNPSATGT